MLESLTFTIGSSIIVHKDAPAIFMGGRIARASELENLEENDSDS